MITNYSKNRRHSSLNLRSSLKKFHIFIFQFALHVQVVGHTIHKINTRYFSKKAKSFSILHFFF